MDNNIEPEARGNDLRSRRWPALEPMALLLIRKFADGNLATLRSLLAYYVSIVEFITMNGPNCKISRKALEGFSGVAVRRQKKYRDMLIEMRLLRIRSQSVPGSGTRVQQFYDLMDAPWQDFNSEKSAEKKFSTAQDQKFSTGFSTGAEGHNDPREQSPSNAGLLSYPQGAEGHNDPRKVLKLKEEKQKLTASPEENPPSSPKNEDKNLSDQKRPARVDGLLHGKELVEHLKESYRGLSRKEIVGMLGGILIYGTKMIKVPPLAYKQIGILLSRVPVPALIDIFNRWDYVPIINGKIALIGATLNAYRYWSANRAAVAGEEFKKPVSPEGELKKAMEGMRNAAKSLAQSSS